MQHSGNWQRRVWYIMIAIQDLRQGPTSPASPLLPWGRVCSSSGLCRTHFHLVSIPENTARDTAQSTGSIDSGNKGERAKGKAWRKGSLTKGAQLGPPSLQGSLLNAHEGNCGQNGFVLRFGLLTPRAVKNLLEAGQPLSHSLPICLFPFCPRSPISPWNTGYVAQNGW